MAHNYILRVTAGPEYDVKTHQVVPVNSSETVKIETDLCGVEVNVRIQDYHGLPHSSPSTTPYFSLPSHAKNKDAYSISFHLTPKQSINGNDLVFGNDFDHPIRDRLPPGFGTAFKIVKWLVDPGLDGDVYADRPYLYGTMGGSVNLLHVGDKQNQDGGKVEVKGLKGKDADGEEMGLVFEEGGTENGLTVRGEKGVPEGEAARKKWFLDEENRKTWVWEEGRGYACDFFNPYLDFNDFALRLPGFTLPIMKYWDGQGLRYVLKNRATDTVLFVVLFTLYLKEDVDEEGNIREGVEAGVPFEKRGSEERGRYEGAKDGEEEEKKEKVGMIDTNEDDVD